MTTAAPAAEPDLRPPIRHRYSSEERKRILKTVFLDRSDGWIARFTTMMILAVTIAALGLLADSPAIVIGAMLIAPLMTPLQALSVAVAMGWGRKIPLPLATVAAAVGGSIALAWALAGIIPSPSEITLPAEVLARTSPDLRDLLVALAAGAAGAYATAREDVSAALPGVAVAVALVPPLAATGICLQVGRSDLAVGAGLLFLTNLVAILLAGMLVLFVTGFVPLPHFRRVRRTVIIGVLPVLVATVFVAVPLAGALDRTVSRANRLSDVSKRVVTWLGADSGLEVDRIRVNGPVVELDLVGSQPPPPARDLAAQLSSLLGDEATVHVRWSLRHSADVAATSSGEGQSPADPGALRPIVTAWLAKSDPQAEVSAITQGAGGVVITVAASSEPPAAESLRGLIAQELGAAPERVEVRWTQRRVYAATAGSTTQDARARASAVVETWIDARPTLVLDEVEIASSRVTVRLRGPAPPAGIAELEQDLRAAIGPATTLELVFTPQQVITPASEEVARQSAARDATVRSAVDSWISAVPEDSIESVVTEGTVVVVAVVGPAAPPPAAALAESLSAVLAAPTMADVRWLEGRGTDRAAWFPTRSLRVLAGASLFPYGSSALVANAGAVLEPLAAELATIPTSRRIVIAGHTDGPGSPQLNLDLSRQRGEAIRSWLAANGGIDGGRLVVVAYGESRPVASNDTAEGRNQNRRIEILIESP